MNQLIDIFCINEDIVQSFTDKPTPPQRNNYEELVVVSEGAPKYVLDFKTLKFPSLPKVVENSYIVYSKNKPLSSAGNDFLTLLRSMKPPQKNARNQFGKLTVIQ